MERRFGTRERYAPLVVLKPKKGAAMTSGIAALLGIIAGWFGRGVESYLIRKGENLATKEDVAGITHEIEAVKQQYSDQGERLRYELQATVQERGMRFAKLHERRAEAMDGLYKRLVRTLRVFEPLAGSIKKVEDEQFQVKLDAAGSAAQEVLTYFTEERLYFDQSVIDGFGAIDNALHTAWVTFNLERIDGDWRYTDESERAEQIKLWRDARATIRSELPALIRDLERKMRAQLGDEAEGGAGPVTTQLQVAPEGAQKKTTK